MNNQLEKITNNLTIQELKDELINNPKQYVKLLKFFKAVEGIKKDKNVLEAALEYFSRYPEKAGEIDGIKWEYKNGSGRYLYDQDGEYASLKEQRDKLDELMKQRAEILKTATKYHEQGRELVVDGEVVNPVGYVAYSDSISVK